MTDTEVTAARRVVARGEAVLDEKDPGWWRADADPAINLEVLAMASPDHCVLGQRCPLALRPGDGDMDGPFWAYALALAGAEPGEDDLSLTGRVEAWAQHHGFEAGDDTYYPDLTDEWARVIKDRRAAA